MIYGIILLVFLKGDYMVSDNNININKGVNLKTLFKLTIPIF